MAFALIRAFGASATPISFGELYTALQQGVVDGAENNPPSFHLARHYEVCKFYSLDEHTSVPDVVIIGTHFWNSLTKQQQQWMQEAADESAVFQQKLWSASTVESSPPSCRPASKSSAPTRPSSPRASPPCMPRPARTRSSARSIAASRR